MPSLLRKLSKRRRSSRKLKQELVRSASVGTNLTAGNGNNGKAPISSISIDRNDLVSPLKSPLKKAMSSPSSLTDSTFRCSSDSWSDDVDSTPATPTRSTTSQDYLALIQEQDPSRSIPPRPSETRWQEDDFLKVVHVWNLSQDEINKLRELEGKLFDVTHWKNNPFEVVRFMKGPQGYKPAERLFRKMIDWRIKENVDTILQDYTPPPVLLDYVPSAILHGLDHDGDPIYVERAGATDVAGLLKKFGHKALIRHLIWLRELCGRGAWIKDHEEKMGRPITQVTIVYDLSGLNSRHLRPGVLPFFGHMMKLTQENYTGPVKRMVIIRAPSIFRVVWGVCKHFFDPWAVAKMTFTGPDDYEEILSKFMPLEVLPPAVSPNYGIGLSADGMPSRWEGGIPPSMDYTEQISKAVPTKVIAGQGAESIASTAEDSYENDSSTRVSVSTSTLGSGFFQMDAQGDVSYSNFFQMDSNGNLKDDHYEIVDPLA